MQQAGYLQLNRQPVLDEDGHPLDIIELHLYGARLGIRVRELREALRAGISVRVEKIRWNWMAYPGGTAGRAQVSKSGKALNIELRNGERFTLALDALSDVLGYRQRSASVAALPPRMISPVARNRRITDYSPGPAYDGCRAAPLSA